MAGEMQEPRKTLPRSIFLAAPLIMLLYLVGTVAVLALVPSGQGQRGLRVSPGDQRGAAKRGHCAGAGWCRSWPRIYVLGNIGGIGAWLTGPARVALLIGLDRYFPPAFGRIHPKWKTP